MNRIPVAVIVVATSITVGVISYRKGKNDGMMEAVNNLKRENVKRFHEKHRQY